MYILTQTSLFNNSEIENLGDLERLKLAVENIPDAKIIRKLYELRKNGRNDWAPEVLWNTFVASFVFNHRSVSDLLRELSRNKQLRDICGLQPKYHLQKDGTTKISFVPSEAAYSRFLCNLKKCEKEMKEAFEELRKYMYENLEGFGESLAGDGKAIQSYATKNGNRKNDNRGDHDANWGVKKYTESTNDKGEKVSKKVSWFGYRLHLIVDTKYELPVAYAVTPVSNSEKAEMLKLWEELNSSNKEIMEKAKQFLADKGYDMEKLIVWLVEHDITPIIDIQNHWKNGEKTKQYRDTDLTYTYDGKVYYTNDKGEAIKLSYAGYDRKTDTLRYKFPPSVNDKRIFRIKYLPNQRNQQKE